MKPLAICWQKQINKQKTNKTMTLERKKGYEDRGKRNCLTRNEDCYGLRQPSLGRMSNKCLFSSLIFIILSIYNGITFA